MSCEANGGGGPVFPIYVGDLLPAWTASARTCDGPFSWVGWVLIVEFRGPVVVNGTLTGDADGQLLHGWTVGETDVPGDYTVLVHGISPSPESKPRTFVVEGVVRMLTP